MSINQSTDEMKQVELAAEEARKKVDHAESLRRLMKNRDFRKVIEVGLLRERAVELVALKADPNQQSEEDQASLDREIVMVGELRQHFSAVLQIGKVMEKTLAGCEATMTELQEELEAEQE